MSTNDLRRDEHNRVIWPNSKALPVDAEAFTIWHGRIVHPDRIVIDSQLEHDRHCRGKYGGWMPSGDWWFHCGICRPEAVEDTP